MTKTDPEYNLYREEKRLDMESKARQDFDNIATGRRSDVKAMIEKEILDCRAQSLDRLTTAIRLIDLLAIKLEMKP